MPGEVRYSDMNTTTTSEHYIYTNTTIGHYYNDAVNAVTATSNITNLPVPINFSSSISSYTPYVIFYMSREDDIISAEVVFSKDEDALLIGFFNNVKDAIDINLDKITPNVTDGNLKVSCKICHKPIFSCMVWDFVVISVRDAFDSMMNHFVENHRQIATLALARVSPIDCERAVKINIRVLT